MFRLQGKCYQCDIHNNAAISMLTKEGVLRRDTTKLIALGPQVVSDCASFCQRPRLIFGKLS